MSNKIPCTKCGAMILPATANATGGLCMPCKNGYRKQIEDSKEHYRKQKEYDPVRECWKSLIDRVHKTESGFSGLSAEEQLYFSVCVFNGEVYNGGIHQFFTNSSGEYYQCVVDGLLELKALKSLEFLTEAKKIFFGDIDVPTDRMERYSSMKEYPDEGADEIDWCIRLEAIDKEYWKDPDKLGEKLEAYAETKGLIEPFKK